MSELDVEVSSPPDRKHLVADIVYNGVQVAEINQEKGDLQIEVYPTRTGEPWKFEYAAFLDAIRRAEQRLHGQA